MKAKLREFWLSRAPRERVIMAILAVVAVVASYSWLLQTADQAQTRLRTSVPALREQAARLEQQAAELERLRAAPAISASQTDLRTLVQERADAAGLSRALLRIDAPEANHVVTVFGAVPFAEWLAWIASLRAQHVRLDTCRIEALSTPGLVSVTANLTRANPQ